MIVHSFERIRVFVRSQSYESEFRVSEFTLGRIAGYLLVSDIFFLTRFYALSNLVETILFLMVAFSPRLRAEFIKCCRSPIVSASMMFFAWCLIAGLWSHVSWLLVLEDWWGWRKLLLLPIGLIVFNDPKMLRLGTIIFVLVGCLFVLLSFTTWLFDLGHVWGRLYSHIVQNHNAQGVYFSLLAMTLFAVFGLCKRGSIGWYFIFLVILLSIFLVAVVGTSRTGYVSFLVCTFTVAAYFFSNNIKIILAVLTLAFCALVMFPQSHERITQAYQELSIGFEEAGGHISSGSIRAVMWVNTIEVIREHWLVGTGAGAFRDKYAEVANESKGWRAKITDDPHNQYLHILAEYGLVGLMLFIYFGICLFLSIEWRSRWGFCLLATILIGFTVGLFNGIFGSAVEGRILQICFALFLTLQRSHDRARE